MSNWLYYPSTGVDQSDSLVPSQMTANKRMIASRFNGKGSDFLVFGDAEKEIIDMANKFGRSVVVLKLTSMEDYVGVPVFYENGNGRFFDRIPDWIEPIKAHPDEKFLLLIDVDDADDRAVIALKPHDTPEKRGYLIGVICRDKTRVLPKHTTDLLKPLIYWE